MTPESINMDDVYQASLGGVPLSAGTTFIDELIDWIVQKANDVIDSVTGFVRDAWSGINDTITTWVSWAVNSITGGLTSISSLVSGALSWLERIYASVSSFTSGLWATVSSAIQSANTSVNTWVNTAAAGVSAFIATTAGTIYNWIANSAAGLWSNISAGFNQLTGTVSGLISSWGQNLVQVVAGVPAVLSNFTATLAGQLSSYFDYLRTWMLDNIIKPLSAWFDTFVTKILDFPAWIGKLFDAVSAWLNVDIPGHSPRWTAILDGIGHWFATWFYEFPKWFFGDFGENVAYGLQKSFKWVGDTIQTIVGDFTFAMLHWVTLMTPKTPQQALANYASIANVGFSALFGLLSMTVAGELLHPIKTLGLGNISAMIFDLSNYKLITGAFIGAISYVTIRQPITYFLNSVNRPNLPGVGQTQEMWASDDIERPEFNQVMAYQGFSDHYIDILADGAYEPPTLTSLTGLITGGAFDRDLFADILRRRRIPPKLRPLMLDMYERKAQADTKAYGTGNALTRLKLGLTTEGQCAAELAVLHATDKEIPVYLAAANLAYATDYTQDLMTAYRDAFRAGNTALDDYRQELLSLGLVPERVEGLVLIERARIKPTERLTPLAPAKQLYLTDEGKVQLDTLRRRRAKELITRDEEIAGLLELGLSVSYADAIAGNDDIKLTESEVVTTKVEPPFYETEAGKVQVDTIRRQRRKGLTTREEELTALLALGMPDWFAAAIADNDDVRLTEKTPPQA